MSRQPDYAVKRSAIYIKDYGLRIERDLKEKIEFLSGLSKNEDVKNAPDVPEEVRKAIRPVIERLYEKFKSFKKE